MSDASPTASPGLAQPAGPALRILGVDGGLAALGWAVLALVNTRWKVEAAGVLTSTPTYKGRGVPECHEVAERVRFQAREGATLLDRWRPVALGMEGLIYPQPGQGRFKVVSIQGRGRGVWDCLAELRGLPLIEESPRHLKFLVTGNRSASKAQVQQAVGVMFPELAQHWPPQRTLHEHVADATAAGVAAAKSPLVAALCRAQGLVVDGQQLLPINLESPRAQP